MAVKNKNERVLIINADDFGKDAFVNGSVTICIRDGLISSSTLIANLNGFEEATDIIKRHNLQSKVGVHLNIVEGRPLTSAIRYLKEFCDDEGCFHGEPLNPYFLFPSFKKKKYNIIKNELRMQISRCKEIPIPVTHLDSHWHRHRNWIIGKMCIELAKEFGIKFIRQGGGLSKSGNIYKKTYGVLYNSRLKINGAKGTDELYAINDLRNSISKNTGIHEIIVHPVLKDNHIYDSEFSIPLRPILEQFAGYSKMSFGDLI